MFVGGDKLNQLSIKIIFFEKNLANKNKLFFKKYSYINEGHILLIKGLRWIFIYGIL